MIVTKLQLLRMIKESVRSSLQEMSRKTTVSKKLPASFEFGAIIVHGIYFPGWGGSRLDPPDPAEFQLQTVELEGGEEISPEDFLARENEARMHVGEKPLTEEELYFKVEEEVLIDGIPGDDRY